MALRMRQVVKPRIEVMEFFCFAEDMRQWLEQILGLDYDQVVGAILYACPPLCLQIYLI